MSDYGCCTLSVCNWIDGDVSCDDCPFYDPTFFKDLAEGKMTEEEMKQK